MAVMDPFAGAAAENQDQKKALLDVIAQSGSAGEKAFHDAQSQIASTKQEALDRASQRAAITGQNFGGLDTARVGETADRFTNYGTNANQQFQQNLQGVGASGQSYLDKIGAIAPFIQSQNTNKASDRENQYKIAIAQAQEAADAAAAKIKQQQDFELLKMGISNKNAQDLAGMRANTAAQKAAMPTVASLQGQANQAQMAAQKQAAPALKLLSVPPQKPTASGNMGSLGSVLNSVLGAHQQSAVRGAGGQSVIDLARMDPTELASQLGRAQGASDIVLNSLYNPTQMVKVANAIKKNTPMPPLDQQQILATKVPGIDNGVAKTISSDKEYQNAMAGVSDFLNSSVDTNGKINEGGEWDGYTPYDAYITFMNTIVAPQKTRTKEVIGKTVGPMFASLGRK